CSIVGCTTNRNTHKDLSIFRLPSLKTENPRRLSWRKEWLHIILKDRVLDNKLQKQIDKNNVYVCEKHFKVEDLLQYAAKKEVREFCLPTENLPKKHLDLHEVSRPTSSIEKREIFQQNKAKHDIPKPNCYKSFKDFLDRIQRLSLKGWTIVNNHLGFVEIRKNLPEYLGPKFQIFVKEDLTFRLRIHGWMLSLESEFMMKTYNSMQSVTLSYLITILEKYQLCQAVDLVEFKEAVNLQHHMVQKAFDFRDNPPENLETPLHQEEYLRSMQCQILIENAGKCTHCHKMEIKLRSQLNTKKNSLKSPLHPNAPLSFVSPDKLVETVKLQRVENKALMKETKILRERLEAAIEKNSMDVTDDLNNDLIDIFKGIPEDKVPPFMRLFWEEQQKYIRAKTKSQIRYHPAIIKFCLSIASKSPAAYEQLRLNDKDGTGVMVLPSQRTLRDYRNYIKPKQGFNPEVIQDLIDRTKEFSDRERYVNILIDEMKNTRGFGLEQTYWRVDWLY
uniref:THAP-type domain-containing protein n=1 Tax=Clytia hemisphaerica TaxID=252671 RepID=A0A7M5WX04_9CNID